MGARASSRVALRAASCLMVVDCTSLGTGIYRMCAGNLVVLPDGCMGFLNVGIVGHIVLHSYGLHLSLGGGA